MHGTSAIFKSAFVFFFCLFLLCSCGGGNNDGHSNPIVMPPDPLPLPSEDFNETELGLRIRQDYYNYLVDIGFLDVNFDSVLINKNYGVYDNANIVLMHVDIFLLAVVNTVVVDGILIEYGDMNFDIIAWKDGQIFELQEARNLNILTREELMNIADRHNGNNYSIDGNHVGLSISAEKEIISSYLSHIYGENVFNHTEDDVWIDSYFGTYIDNSYRSGSSDASSFPYGLVAVMMDFKGSGYACVERDENIDGILFHYNNNIIIIWRSGAFLDEFYGLRETYDNGLLTRDNLNDIAIRMEHLSSNCHDNN